MRLCAYVPMRGSGSSSIHHRRRCTEGCGLLRPWRLCVAYAGMAASKGWGGLVQPALLAGIMGYATGSTFGFCLAKLIAPPGACF